MTVAETPNWEALQALINSQSQGVDKRMVQKRPKQIRNMGEEKNKIVLRKM